jgi:hypothetical protein
MRAVLVVGAVALLLTGCGAEKAGAPTGGHSTRAVAMESAPMAADAAAPEAEPAHGGGEGGAPGQTQTPPGAPMLAYVYGATLEIPSGKVEAVMQAHIGACERAGPKLCQVLGSNVSRSGDDQIYANLNLRAEPKWLATFRGSLDGDANKAGGRITEQSVQSEDLTRAITDTEARLRAQKTLRDRLQQILRERPGKLQELLETERELARVQGEIDSMESMLAVMRERVAMSMMNLNYQTKPTVVSGGTFDPIINAFNDFVGLMAGVVGFMIRAIAVALPVILVLGVPLWLFLRWRRKKREMRENQTKTGF